MTVTANAPSHKKAGRSQARKPGRQPTAATSAAQNPRWLDLLRCPRCDGSLRMRANIVACESCHHRISSDHDILDFVDGQLASKLDTIDYDEFYRVGLGSSELQFQQVIATAGDRWPPTLGAVLEIGCGTGGFSMGLVKSGACDQAVLTDVSPKMLGICRRHLAEQNILDVARTGFATYGGTEKCFRSRAFDSCVGAWVVHHIVDVPRFFGQVFDTLKPGGRAFFLEPNQRFHQALIAALCDIVALKLAQGTAPTDSDLVKTMGWISEIHFNIVNSGDVGVLAGREDKHLFIGEALEQMGREAGFTEAENLRFGHDPNGISTAGTYLSQCNVSEDWIAEVMRMLPHVGAPYFSLLHARDQSPSFLVWLTRPVETAAERIPAAPNTAARPAADAIAVKEVRCWLDLSRRDAAHPEAIAVIGWCLAPTSIKALDLTLGAETKNLYPHRPRPDVHVAMNAARTYPSVQSLCSGVEATLTWTGIAEAGDDGPLRVSVRTTMGGTIELGEVTLPEPGQSVIFSI